MKKRFDDRDEAKKAATEFVEFCKGRAWVFTDTGMTKYDESLYQFTHRTFLEFFTAAYIVRKYHDPQKLLNFLLPKIIRREWDIVVQLAFQRLNKNVDDAGNQLLSSLIQKSREDSKNKWNLLSFAVRCLEFIIPSPKVTKEITNEYIRSHMEWGLNRANNPEKITRIVPTYENQVRPQVVLGHLLNADIENINVIIKNLEKSLIDYIYNGKELETCLAIELGLHLKIPFLFNPKSLNMDKNVKNLENNLKKVIFSIDHDKINLLCLNYYPICHNLYHENKISIKKIIEMHGIEKLFEPVYYAMFLNVSSHSLAATLLNRTIVESFNEKFDRDLEEKLKELGETFISMPKPFICSNSRKYDIFRWSMYFRRYSDRKSKLTFLSHDALFGLFVLIAIFLEFCKSENQLKYVEDLKKCIGPMFLLFLPRFKNNIEKDRIMKKVSSYNFNFQQREFILKWIANEFDLVDND